MSDLEFRGIHKVFLDDTTEEIDLEGSLSCGKTTVALVKELRALVAYPGIWSLLTRWTGDAVDRLLRPAIEQLARIENIKWSWDNIEKCYELPNGSRAFAFGLQTQSQDPVQRYGKIRGLPVSRIYVDQAEQLPADIASELRARLRPDIEARLRGVEYPRQLTFTPNPVNDDHWLAKQFSATNKIKGRRYYSLSLYDNAHNLPADMIESMLREYPPEHPKHQTVILGQRGLNVIGDAIYESLFDRKVHVREVQASADISLIEAFEVGKHNPCWIIGQRSYHGGLLLLGGVLGKRMVLDDFLPLVQRYRQDWFPSSKIQTCTAPMGESSDQNAHRFTLLSVLREAGFRPIWQNNSNAPDVQLAMIEQVAALLRRRTTAHEEAIAISNNPAHWLSVAPDGTIKPVPFLAFAFEGGYVWSEHWVSVSNKELRQPYADDEYANAMRCLEHLVLNFCSGHRTTEDRDAQRAKERLKAEQQPTWPQGPHGWMG